MANSPKYGYDGEYGDEKQFQEDMKQLRKQLAERVVKEDGNAGKEEAVDHPSHYNSGKFEVIDVIADAGLGEGFCLGNALKYILRAKHKVNYSEDLQKAEWYLRWWNDYIKTHVV